MNGVPQVRDSDALDDLRVTEDARCAVEVVEESDSGAEQDRGDVDVELVDQSSIQQLLNGVGAMHRDGPVTGGSLGLGDGALEAVSDEVNCRGGPRPPGWNLMGQHEGPSP
jgi:hypothetical protein